MSIFENLKAAWLWLTEPATAVTDPDMRQRVRIFSAVQLVIVLGLISPTLKILPVDSNFRSAPFLPELVLQTIAYGLSRSRYYKFGVIVSLGALLGMAVFASFTSPYFGPEVMALHLMWLVLPLLYGSVIFSRKNTILLALAVLLSFLLLPLLIPELAFLDIAPVAFFVGIWTVGHLYVMRHNERLEMGRRANLRQTAAALTAVNESLQTEIAERKLAEAWIEASLTEKEALLKEIHHRVKNNLQVISSLLNLQSAQIEEPLSREMFRESQHRVRSMALIHEKLYQSPDLAQVDFAEYLRNLTMFLFRSYSGRSSRIELTVEAEPVFLGVDTAVPCGLILNELVSNSLKHGFPNRETGHIRVRLERKDDAQIILCVGDNGIGFPDQFRFEDAQTLGLQLVRTLANQLGGAVELDQDRGTAVTVAFPQPYAEIIGAGARQS